MAKNGGNRPVCSENRDRGVILHIQMAKNWGKWVGLHVKWRKMGQIGDLLVNLVKNRSKNPQKTTKTAKKPSKNLKKH
jgi:hypothetical protein